MTRIKNTLGIDIGGTSIKAGFLPGPGPRCLRFKSFATPQTAWGIWDKLVDIIIDYASRYRLDAVGIGCPGPLDINKGIIINPPNLPIKNFPLKELLEKETRLPISLDNDANAFTLAEATWGAGKKYQNVVGLTLGTGVGGGIVIDKKIYHGRGNAGELGYLLQNIAGPRGPFGERGALQEFIKAKTFSKTQSPAQLARRRDRQANKIWHDFGNYLGYSLATITHVLDPNVIILGGQIAKAWPRFIKPLMNTFKQNCILEKLPIIRRAQLGDAAGVVGAALLTGK